MKDTDDFEWLKEEPDLTLPDLTGAEHADREEIEFTKVIVDAGMEPQLDEEFSPPEPEPEQVEFVPEEHVAPRPHIVITPPSEPDAGRGSTGNGNAKWIALAAAGALAVALMFVLLIKSSSGKDTRQTETVTPSPSPTVYEPIVVTAPPEIAVTPTPEPTPSPVPTYSITVTSGKGGSIQPYGTVEVERGGEQQFLIIPEDGYEIAQLLIDGYTVSPENTYLFTDVQESHTIYAVFRIASEPEPSPSPEPSPEPTPEPETEWETEAETQTTETETETVSE